MSTGHAPREPKPDAASGVSRQAQGLRTVAAAVIVIAGLKLGADLLVPILLAAFFAMALMPLAEKLQDKGLHASLASLTSFVLGALLIMGLGWLLATSLSGVQEALPRYEERLGALTERVLAWAQAKGIDVTKESVDSFVAPDNLLRVLRSLLASVGGVLSTSIVVLLVMLFMLFERATISGDVRGSGPFTAAQLTLQRVTRSVTDYLAVKTIISLITGVLFGVACWWIGVDFPLLWGLLAFLLNYIPNIGSVMAAIPPTLIALITLGWDGAFWVIVANVGINSILGNVIEPKVMGNKVGLSALTIFLSLLFWSWVFGPVGTILSVPLTIAAKAILRPENEPAAQLAGA